MSPTPASWSPRQTLSKQQPPQQQHRNSPLYTARLMSLANYIRHIISLSSANKSQLTTHEQQRQQKIQGCRPMSSYPSESVYNTGNSDQGNMYSKMYLESTSLPSPQSAGSGPGPIKSTASLSSRKHRYSSVYHDHQTRRQVYHHHQQQERYYQQDRQNPQVDQVHRLPSPTSPTAHVHYPISEQQPMLQGAGAAVSPSIKNVSTFLKIPHPNLTMTLALIYVDRLKAVSTFIPLTSNCGDDRCVVSIVLTFEPIV